jgi:hypothetical protein
LYEELLESFLKINIKDRRNNTCLENGLFCLGVGGELSCVDDHGSAHGGDGSSPEGQETFLAEDAEQRVEHVLVVAALKFIKRKDTNYH